MFREKEIKTNDLAKEKVVNIQVTPNVKYCLKLMEMAVKGLPNSDLKSSCQSALEYLLTTAKGVPQHYNGEDCNWRVIIPHWQLPKTSKYYKPKS